MLASTALKPEMVIFILLLIKTCFQIVKHVRILMQIYTLYHFITDNLKLLLKVHLLALSVFTSG